MLSILVILISLPQAFAQNAMNSDCEFAHTAAVQACGASATAPACAAAAGDCVSKCTTSAFNSSNFSDSRCTLTGQTCTSLSQLTGTFPTKYIPQCQAWAGSGNNNNVVPPTIDPRSSDDVKKCMAYQSKYDTDAKWTAAKDSDLAACVDVCNSALQIQATAAIKDLGQKCFDNIDKEPPVKISTVNPPTDGGTDAGADTAGADTAGADNGNDDVVGTNSTPVDPGTSNGSTNGTTIPQLPSMGGGQAPTIGGTAPSVNWATGPDPDPGLFDSVAADVTSAASAGGAPSLTDGSVVGNVPGAPYMGTASTNQNGAASAAAPMGAGMPSPYMGGGGGMMPPSSPGGSSRSSGYRGGGPVAGSQVSKVGHNTFYSGGGSASPSGGTKSAAVAPTRRPAFPPRYPSGKSDDGSAALARLFGKNLKNDYYNSLRKNQYGPDYGKSCLNTVFCGIESSIQQIMWDMDLDVPNTSASTGEAKTVRGTASQPKGK